MIVFKAYNCESYCPIKLAHCKAYARICPVHPTDTCLLQIPPKSPRMSPFIKCHCKLCVKEKPPSLKSLYVNKLHGKSSNKNYKCIKKLCVYQLPTLKQKIHVC